MALLVMMFPAFGDPPVPPPPPACSDAGCTNLSYEEFARRNRGEIGSTGWEALDPNLEWVPIAGGSDIELMSAYKERVEDDGPPLGVDVTDLRQIVEPDDAARIRATGGQLVEPEPALTAANPDDVGFADVVLVGSDRRYHCTGVLVAVDAVLTAAHCVPANQIAIGHRLGAMVAHVGIRSVDRHPFYDAALLHLARSVPLPIRPRRGVHPPPEGVVRMIGFGVDDARHPTSFGVKRRVDATANGWGCDLARSRVTGCRANAELVLTAVGGGDTCYGDSGGPVLELVDGVYRLIAITSRPTASGGASCGRGGIYVRVDVLEPWLTSHLKDHP